MPKILGFELTRVKKDATVGLAQPVNMGNPPPNIEQALRQQGMDPSRPFSPGRPINPYFAYSGEPRQFDFATGVNITARPRQGRISFPALRDLTSVYDVARMCISHRIDSFRSFEWAVVPADGESGDLTTAIAAGRKAIAKPDGRTPYSSWIAMYLEDVLRYDAGTFYKRRDQVGRVIGLEVVDGTTIAPMLDEYGRPPLAPAPGFIQYANGVPWDWLTSDDLIYLPFRPQPDSPYGLAPMEQIILTANTDLRLANHLLDYWAEGSIPGATAEAPEKMSSPDEIAELQEAWNDFVEGDQTQKVKVRWLPFGSKFTQLRPDPFDEELALWLFRKTCATYSVTPQDLGITLDTNKATGDTQMDVQERIADRPLTLHVEGILTDYLQNDLGLPLKMDISLSAEKQDRVAEAQVWKIGIESGMVSSDEGRTDMFGLPIDNERPTPRFILDPKSGPIPLQNLYAIAGPIDPETGGPADADPITDVPYVSAPGLIAVKQPGATNFTRAPINPDDPGHPANEHVIPSTGTIAPVTAVQAVEPTLKSLQRVRKDANKALIAAGLVIRALDTGRVLMLQRGMDDTDPAAGTWEWPGGHIEDGETAWQAACREWQEETGCQIPDGQHGGSWTVGIYQGFVWIIESESELCINSGSGRVVNPDDPDGDSIETVAWFDPADVPGMPALRPECRTSDFDLIAGLLPTVKELTAGVTASTGITGVNLEGGIDDEYDEDLEEVLKELRRWRENARGRVKKGQPPRLFTSDVLPEVVIETVWKSLEPASDRSQVDAAFEPVIKAGGVVPKVLASTSV